ncbi:MAG: FtsX-like permease family protein [Opitutaceae bacterium]
MRAALGASRTQLLRPLLAESLLLSSPGAPRPVVGDLGDGMAFGSFNRRQRRAAVLHSCDPSVLGWALGASLVTALVFGLAPALFALRLDLNHTLKSGGRGTTGGRGHRHFRNLLIVRPVRPCPGAARGRRPLCPRGLDGLNQRRSGWSSEQLVSGSLLLPVAVYPDAESISAFQHVACWNVWALLPGVATASLASYLPYFNWPVPGLPRRRPAAVRAGKQPAAVVNGISPRYFETVGTRLVAGASFSPQDSLTSPRVYIINQAMARALFGDENPIGRRLGEAQARGAELGEIVGVVGNVVSILPDSSPVTSQLYYPMSQRPRARFEIAVRAAGNSPEALVSLVRTAMSELDPDLPVRRLKSADAIIHRANYQLGVLRDMLISFAVLGLGLATLGIYGVIARTTALRTEEFAIRLALGACARDILRLVLRSGAALALVGSALGLLGAVGVSRLLVAGFPGIPFQRAPILLGATLVLFGVALLASWLPARRASRIDAIQALRAD